MSHCYGQVRFADGLTLHYEYDGTGDVALNPLRDTPAEVWAHWRTWPDVPACACGRDEPVEIASEYGGGFYWTGRACRYCRVITDGQIDFEDREIDGLPQWWLNLN